MSRLVQNASYVPSERYQDLASSMVFWHILHAGHGMTDDCDGVHASWKGLVTIDDVPIDVVRKEVRLFINCHKKSRSHRKDAIVISEASRAELLRKVLG